MTRFFRLNRLRRSDGWVLVEVMMAVVLLGLLVVPLAAGVQSATGRANTVRSQAARVSDPPQDPDGGDAWEWGATVSSAWWRPGPSLYIQLEQRSGQDHIAGLWVNGWFQGEVEPDDDGTVRVGAPAWYGSAGEELVVRVRTATGTWGPPWRLVVPAADGVSASSALAGDGGSGETIAHVPALANPALRPSWVETSPQASPPGFPFLLPSPGPGTGEIDLDDRRQFWNTEAGRGLDVYF